MLHIIVAGILALPSLLLIVISALIIGLLSIPSLSLLLYRPKRTSPSSSTNSATNYHVIVTGGSSGIGLSIAKQCVERGIQKVSILARNPQRLQSAKEGLEQVKKDTNNTETIIQAISVSVSDYEAISKVAEELCGGGGGNGSDGGNKHPELKIVLFHCAGTPYTTYFEEIPTSRYYELVQTNQLGVMYVTRAFLPYMSTVPTITSRPATTTTTTTTSKIVPTSTTHGGSGVGGTIVFTSSAAGQLGVFGYGAYAPTKWALRGFAETLHMEYSHDPNLHVQIAFPVDTDTPGYQAELELMPEETKALNDSAGLACPAETAKSMIQEAMAPHPRFAVYFTFEGWMLSNLTAGMSPVTNLFDALSQVALMSLFRFISLFYLNDFWRIIRNIQESKRKEHDAVTLKFGTKKAKTDSEQEDVTEFTGRESPK